MIFHQLKCVLNENLDMATCASVLRALSTGAVNESSSLVQCRGPHLVQSTLLCSQSKVRRASRVYAKFERFEGGREQAVVVNKHEAEAEEQENPDEDVEDTSDSVFPADLEGAIEQSAESTSQFLSAGGKRALVELSLMELENFDTDGAQQQLWDCSRLFVKSVQKRFQNQKIKAIFPDMGAAAYVKFQWKDETIKYGSLNDRKPVTDDDEIIMLIAPDHQMLDQVQKIAYSLLDDDDMQEKPLIMWNPQLFSGDVGIGLNVRRVRNEFLRTFTTVYSLKPLPTGAIFKRYPGLWKIFLDDKQRPGRYLFAREQASKPDAEDLEAILLQGSAPGDEPQVPSFLANAMATMSYLGRFMRALSQ
ncbi:uncharacterized protein LOC9649254 [Selaginella moellendorffii]|nr:uncharacterized protein LOC9649254 [Selaginella moellendorffii]|eukprot:XP_002985127.2 uncharacterized protein LOC9649254 [Selaginella moellendorffii]